MTACQWVIDPDSGIEFCTVHRSDHEDLPERFAVLLDEMTALRFAALSRRPDQTPDSRKFRLAYHFGCDCESEAEHLDRIFGGPKR
jgi:hypothetical protein